MKVFNLIAFLLTVHFSFSQDKNVNINTNDSVCSVQEKKEHNFELHNSFNINRKKTVHKMKNTDTSLLKSHKVDSIIKNRKDIATNPFIAVKPKDTIGHSKKRE